MFTPSVRSWGAALVAALALHLPSASSGASERIPAREAKAHVGETLTVCGPVAVATRLESARGRPTFLNFDRPYPNQTFTVVIWGDAAEKFPQPPARLYEGKSLCVTGRIETYKGRAQIVVRDPEQIEVVEAEAASFPAERFSDAERAALKGVLAGLGYPADEGSGAWDAAARNALAAFQEARGLPATGEWDAATLRGLAEAAGDLPPETAVRVLRLLLLNLAQREGAPE